MYIRLRAVHGTWPVNGQCETCECVVQAGGAWYEPVSARYEPVSAWYELGSVWFEPFTSHCESCEWLVLGWLPVFSEHQLSPNEALQWKALAVKIDLFI